MEIQDLAPDKIIALLEESLAGAAASGNVSLVRKLLDAGVNPDAVDEHRQSALLQGCRAQDCRLEVVGALLRAGANPNFAPMGEQPLNWVVTRDNPSAQLVKMLLAAGADPNANWGRMLTYAIEVHDNDIEITRALVEAGADVNKAVPMGGPDNKETPFEVAARKGRGDVAKMLLTAGAVVPDSLRDDTFWVSWKNSNGEENPVRRIVNADTMRRNIEQVMAHDAKTTPEATRPSADAAPI